MKGISPLIASVLLIAFTMAIAAVLTAWITQFTEQKQQETSEYEESVACSGANIKVIKDFDYWDSSNKNFSTKIKNTGFIILNVEKIRVWYVSSAVNNDRPQDIALSSISFTRAGVVKQLINSTLAIDKKEEVSVDILLPGEPSKVRFLTSCEGVWTDAVRPSIGW